ncbi:hypothetical protein IP88_11780, partial [alpha proteobacterium AAP81b]
MTDPRWQLVRAAVELVAAAPGLGGIVVRGSAGPVRDCIVAALARRVAVHRLPAQAEVEALDGGLDLAATLAAGRPMARPGLLAALAEAPGVIVVAMAERLAPELAARLVGALDAGAVRLVLLDEGDEDEGVAPALAERLAIHLDISELRLPMAALLDGIAALPAADAEAPGAVAADPAALLATTAAALGVASIRAPIQAMRVARAAAAFAGRADPAEADLALAAALVLGPRATRLPAAEPPAESTE